MERGNVGVGRRGAELGVSHHVTVSWGIVQAELVSFMSLQSH